MYIYKETKFRLLRNYDSDFSQLQKVWPCNFKYTYIKITQKIYVVAEDFAIEVNGYSSYNVAKSLRQLLKLLALTLYKNKEMHLNCSL